MAFHSAILTADQVRDSWQARTTQDLGANTLWRTKWRLRGNTDWETRQANIVGPLSDLLLEPYAAPIGATVVVIDESGITGRDWTLPSTTSYSATESERATTLFVADPYFT